MPYRKLSEQIRELDNPQRSDTFVKLFRNAVREGEFDAAYIPERFELPKQYSRRGSEEKYARDAKDMVFEVTPKFEKWFESIRKDLGNARRAARVKPSIDAFERGELDFKALAEETRRKMDASFKKGQNLGQSRAASARGRTKAAKTTTRRK
ncbi:hypothetical protein [Deinococcus pimensis]|uniref:hypothetical protein n=1 Tax=Deinococcus pimensis TaxID=309888 RepID=UPI00048440F9|nr:hypothetical protein [Deinococcus pimensis]